MSLPIVWLLNLSSSEVSRELGQATLNFKLAPGADEPTFPLTISYTVVADNALADVDFIEQSGIISFASADEIKTIKVLLITIKQTLNNSVAAIMLKDFAGGVSTCNANLVGSMNIIRTGGGVDYLVENSLSSSGSVGFSGNVGGLTINNVTAP